MRQLKGLRYNCSECGAENKARKRNVVIHLYKKQPLYNTIEFKCESCKERMVLFGMWEYIETADMSYWVIECQEYASEEVIKAYAQIYFKDKLPPQDEDCIIYFSRILLDTETLADIDWGEVMSGNVGWFVMFCYIVAWDVWAPETLSDVFYHAVQHPFHKWWVIFIWAVITLHLFKLIPKKYDLIHIVTDLVKSWL